VGISGGNGRPQKNAGINAEGGKMFPVKTFFLWGKRMKKGGARRPWKKNMGETLQEGKSHTKDYPTRREGTASLGGREKGRKPYRAVKR